LEIVPARFFYVPNNLLLFLINSISIMFVFSAGALMPLHPNLGDVVPLEIPFNAPQLVSMVLRTTILKQSCAYKELFIWITNEHYYRYR